MVATVDTTGLITAIAPGTATITVTTLDGAKTATSSVNVVIPVTDVTITPAALVLNNGSTGQLTAAISPVDASNKTVRWTSSDGFVASVDSMGKVTANAPGMATITATTIDGEKTATCPVTVVIPVIGLTISDDSISITNSTTFQLNVTLMPSDATNKNIHWSSSNELVAMVDSTGLVTAISLGMATITVTSEDGDQADECIVTVVQKVDVIAHNNAMQVAVYPNPLIDGLLSISLPGHSRDAEVSVVNSNGQLVYLKGISKNDLLQIEKGKLSPGLNLIIVTDGITTHRQKVMVK
jgi:uncharacterized protein YjdB